jgi:hypothetical protein
MVMSRRQADGALVMRLISASSDRRHHGSPRGDQTPHGGRETRDPFAGFESLVDEGGGERAREPGPEHNRQASDLVSRSPAGTVENANMRLVHRDIEASKIVH